jgi:chromosome segregation ATPase
MPRIEVRNGKAAGRSVELKGSTVTLGNRRNATIELKDSWVSFNHAQITCQGDKYFLADAHSRAGTYLNDRKVDRTPVPINPGDRILLGKTEIVVLGDGAAAPAPTAAPAPIATAAFAALAAAPAAPAVDTSALERELKQAQGDLKDLRAHVIAREKELADANEKLNSQKTTQAKGDAEEVLRWKKACEELKEKARHKLEEMGGYVKQLEARLQAGGGGDAALLVEKEREIARLKAEGHRIQEEAQKRILDAAEKLQQESSDKAELDAERKRADDLEREAGILRSRVEDLESEKKRLAAEVKSVKAEVAGYEQALEERNRDLERLESAVSRQTGGAKASESGGASSEEVERLNAELASEKAHSQDLEKLIVDLRQQVEEINEDMLEQEDELRAEIAALEKKIAEASVKPG